MDPSKVDDFNEFNFESDNKWLEYQRNVTLPVEQDEDYTMLKLKAKWYKKNVDADFEPSWVLKEESSKQQQQRHGDDYSGNGLDTDDDQQPQQQYQPPQQQPPRSQQGAGLTMSYLAALRMGVIIMAFLYLLPSPFQRRAFKYYLLVAVSTHMVVVVQKCGVPKVWPFKWQTIQIWLDGAIRLTDLHYALMCMMYLPNAGSLMIVIPPTVLAVYHTMVYLSTSPLSKTWIWRKYGAKAHSWLGSKQQQALALNASTEIGLGLYQVVALFTPQRNILMMFAYWQILKLRYLVSDSRPYHQQAWRQIGQRIQPVLQYVPVLNYPLDYIKNWFNKLN